MGTECLGQNSYKGPQESSLNLTEGPGVPTTWTLLLAPLTNETPQRKAWPSREPVRAGSLVGGTKALQDMDLWPHRAQLHLHVTPSTLSQSQSPRTTYLLTSEAQRNNPVHHRHNQHHKVGQQPQVLLQLGLPHQVALQETRGVNSKQGRHGPQPGRGHQDVGTQ